LRARPALKRAAKSAFIFVFERGAPLHRELAGQSNPAGSGRRQRVAVVCWRKEIRRLQHTDPPPMLDRPGGHWAPKNGAPAKPCQDRKSIRPTVFGLNWLIGMF
jgi:hypothetical protein